MSGQEVRFTLQGDSSVAYTVTASRTAGPHSFSGMLRDSDRDQPHGGGADTVDGGGSQHSDSQRHPELQPGIGGPWRRAGDGHHPGRRYGGIGRVTETLPAGFDYVSSSPRLGGGECERPGGPVHAARGFLRRLHGHRLQDGGAHSSRVCSGTPTGPTTTWRRRHRHGGGSQEGSDSERHPVLQLDIGGPWRWAGGDGHHPGRQLRGHRVTVSERGPSPVTETLPAGFAYVSSTHDSAGG